jgi:Ca2+-binding EF-hand superfamily protein
MQNIDQESITKEEENNDSSLLRDVTVQKAGLTEAEEEKKALLDESNGGNEKGHQDELEKEEAEKETTDNEVHNEEQEEIERDQDGEEEKKEEQHHEEEEYRKEMTGTYDKKDDNEDQKHEKEKKQEESDDNTEDTDKEEEEKEEENDSDDEHKLPLVKISVSDTTDLVNKNIRAPRLTTQMSVRSMDGSCFFTDEDLDIVDLNSTLTQEDVKQTITDIQEQGGKVNKEKFINTMMDFFPLYNIEENRNKLDKLFDRLDKHKEKLITFRQFMLVAIAFSSVPLQDKLTRIFKLIDENGDEELTYEEFKEIVSDILVLKEERKMSQTDVEERFSMNTFRDMGMNSEGKVNLTSFVDSCTRQKFIIINYVENFKDGFLVNKFK